MVLIFPELSHYLSLRTCVCLNYRYPIVAIFPDIPVTVLIILSFNILFFHNLQSSEHPKPT